MSKRPRPMLHSLEWRAQRDDALNREKQVSLRHLEARDRGTPPPAPPQPTLRDVLFPAYSSLSELEKSMGFECGEVFARGHRFRVLYYRSLPIEYSLGDRHARTIKALLEVA